MCTHDVLMLVQYITIAVLFVEIWIVLLRWESATHSWLFLACVASFLSNLGYLFEMRAKSEEAYVTALKLSYVGRVWIVFSFFLFAAKMCKVRLPKWFMVLLAMVHVFIYGTVFTIEAHGLYYVSYEYVAGPILPRLPHENGIVHDLLMVLNGSLAIIAMAWVIIAFRKEKAKKSRWRLFMLIMAFGTQLFFFAVHMVKVFGVSEYYDLTMPGALFGTVFLLVGIFGFDLLGTKEIARDFVIDRISEGIIAVDNDGRIQYYNEPAAKIYPEFDVFYKSGTVKKNTKHNYTPYDILDFIADAVSKGETLEINDRIYTPEENDLLYKGESYGKLYALVDDTEHYHYMKELQKQRDIADSANEAKSRFLANMSHEIRTPINAVLGMDEMILRESKEKPIRNYASNIMSAGKNLLSLINDILDLSKVEEGRMEIIPVQYDLSSLINDLVHMTLERANKKGLIFTVVADKNIPNLLFGDEIRVRQCATNLLTNAVKYTEAGEVTLTVTYEKCAQDKIRLSFFVKDTGIGMKEEDMENLFAPYKRIEEKRNRSIEGTGLGMSITRQLLSLMGSELSVKSLYGEGSEFSFSVEQDVVKWEAIGDLATRVNESTANNYEYHELFHAPDANILVVDDTEMNLTVIQNLLKRTGIEIDTASSGKEAVHLAEEKLYDVIFVDHMMPDMDGIETLKAIRSSGKSKDTPAVALTANAVSGAREMYLEAGFKDYLSKPVDGEKLEKLLENMLPEEKIVIPEEEEEKLIDEQEGLLHCGSLNGYLSVLSVFHQTAEEKATEIERLYKSGDLENYTIMVHALKSSARIIGAAKLSEYAKELEAAGKRKDRAYIEEHTGELLSMYKEVSGSLSWLSGPDDAKLPEIDAASLKEAYQTAVEIADSMDYGLMEDLLKKLREYGLSNEDKDRLSKMEKYLTELNWDGIKNTAAEAL